MIIILQQSQMKHDMKINGTTYYTFFSDVNFVEYFIKGKSTKSIQLTQVGAYFPKEEMNFSDSVEITESISSDEFSGKYSVNEECKF